MFKKLSVVLTTIILVIITSGCDLKRDTMEDITIYTTNYPITYVTERLYGEHSTITSIYPEGVNINNYSLTNKQISDYSSSDLYIYNGLNENEQGYVLSMREDNENLKIIDTTLSMEYTYGEEELWLDPSNLLMMAQNIKNGFAEYISNYYLNNDIEEEYETLKIELSNLDAKIQSTITNADKKVIVVSDNVFKYLEKYGLTVYSLEDASDKTIEEVKSLINDGTVDHIFIKSNEDVSDTTESIIDETGVDTLEVNMITNLSEQESSEDYFSLMNENIDTLKTEIYD